MGGYNECGRAQRDGAYWDAFEARLAELPKTADDFDARAALVQVAYSSMARKVSSMPDARTHADFAYRFRYELGPQVSEETLQAVRLDLAGEGERLRREGVSPELLGLTG